MKIAKQEYTAEFRELAVKRVKEGQGIVAVARDLGLIEQTLRNWVKAFDAGKLNGPGVKKVTPEEMEVSRLRAENLRLKRELEIIKKRRRTSRRMLCEVRLDCRAIGLLGDGNVRCS
jgi:transposase-like protein